VRQESSDDLSFNKVNPLIMTIANPPPVLLPCEASVSRIVEMAWEDRTPFEAIESQFGLNESAVVALMRRHMKASSFRMWRKRMAGRRTKHAALRGDQVFRHRATHSRQ
jgi:uncharacterized protein (TIGR03643 family)